MFYPSIAAIYTIVIMLSLHLIQYILEILKIKFPSLDNFVKSTPTLIIKDGKFLEAKLKKEKHTKGEIYSSLRLKCVRNMGEVQYAYFEIPGSFSVFTFEKGKEREGFSIVPYNKEI